MEINVFRILWKSMESGSCPQNSRYAITFDFSTRFSKNSFIWWVFRRFYTMYHKGKKIDMTARCWDVDMLHLHCFWFLYRLINSPLFDALSDRMQQYGIGIKIHVLLLAEMLISSRLKNMINLLVKMHTWVLCHFVNSAYSLSTTLIN